MVKKYFVTSSDGTRLSVREAGNPDGRALVFVHGFSASQLVFRNQFEGSLLQHHRLVSFDLRGHGESDKPLDADYYTEGARWADDVKAVMEAAGLSRPVLAGWSLGGRVIAQYLKVYGDGAIAGVNFVSSRNFIDPQRDVLGPAAQYFKRMGTSDLQENIELTSTFIQRCFAVPISEEDFRFNLALNMVVPWQVRAAVLQWPADFTDALKAMTVPCLITHGLKDEVILPIAAEITAAMVPRASLSWYVNCGHSPCWEAPDRFNSELARFAEEAT